MRSVIIAGAARSGKTTLTKRLHQEKGGSVFSGDMLVKTFDQIYPDLGIKSGVESVMETSKNLFPFLSTWLELNDNYAYRRFILDIYHLTPAQVVAQKMHEKYRVAFFGYPTLNVTEKIYHIRTHRNQNDWAADMPDEKLEKMVAHLVEWSQFLQNECAKHHIAFFDTGTAFEQKLEEAYAFLTKTT